MAARVRGVSRSLNEIATLAAKAARGAGFGPAQADRFGQALLYHLAAARDPDQMTGALAEAPKGPIHEGALLCRLLQQHRTFPGVLRLPLTLPETVARSYAATVPHPWSATLRATAGDGFEFAPFTPPSLPERLDLPRMTQTLLNRYARRIYVANTDASRSAGAGAGLTDND